MAVKIKAKIDGIRRELDGLAARAGEAAEAGMRRAKLLHRLDILEKQAIKQGRAFRDAAGAFHWHRQDGRYVD